MSVDCPLCGSLTKVIATYKNPSNEDRRRRECLNCRFRITTREVIVSPEKYRTPSPP